MNTNAVVSSTIYKAFLHCETKAYLLLEGASGVSSEIADWERFVSDNFRQSASERLRLTVPEMNLMLENLRETLSNKAFIE
jgi:hypothetical protein